MIWGRNHLRHEVARCLAAQVQSACETQTPRPETVIVWQIHEVIHGVTRMGDGQSENQVRQELCMGEDSGKHREVLLEGEALFFL